MLKIKKFGVSSQGLPILAYEFGDNGPCIFILGGVHGDEPEGNYMAMGLLHKWIKKFSYKLQIKLIPLLNIEGSLLAQRTNANFVDLNRNLPTKDWTKQYEKKRYYPGPSAGSESETQALIKWINTYKPKLIFSLHSWNPMINTNGNCEPEASILGKETGYTVSNYIGYPTPGSLGDYCMERDIPVITYEAERGGSIKEALTIHVPAIEKALFASEKRT